MDLVAHVLEVLRSDLKTDDGKKYFLRYQATPVLLSFMKTTNKVIILYVLLESLFVAVIYNVYVVLTYYISL